MAQSYLNKKQELFCQFVAGGETYTKAYELAGYEPSTSNASILANKDLVKKRVAELKADYERRENEFKLLADKAEKADPHFAAEIKSGLEWTFQRVMDLMGENVRLAQVAGEYRAANECLKMMGEAMQMFDDATGGNGGNKTPAQGPLAIIGQVTQLLERQGHESDEGRDNPLRPRLGSAPDTKPE